MNTITITNVNIVSSAKQFSKRVSVIVDVYYIQKFCGSSEHPFALASDWLVKSWIPEDGPESYSLDRESVQHSL